MDTFPKHSSCFQYLQKETTYILNAIFIYRYIAVYIGFTLSVCVCVCLSVCPSPTFSAKKTCIVVILGSMVGYEPQMSTIDFGVNWCKIFKDYLWCLSLTIVGLLVSKFKHDDEKKMGGQGQVGRCAVTLRSRGHEIIAPNYNCIQK